MRAHPLPTTFAESLGTWTDAPLVASFLGMVFVTYATGVTRLWRHAGAGRGIRRFEVACFVAGVASMVIALLSPLDYYSDLLFSAHMAQHETLMVVSAPLVVVGRPWVAYAWALPARARTTAFAFVRSPSVRAVGHFLTAPLLVLTLHAAVRWIWHVPRFFEAAMRHEALHGVQHASFFVTAALFWWAIVFGRYGKAGYGLGFLFVFATAVHTSILGALIATAPALIYPIYRLRTGQAGVSPNDDQALAGYIMWVPSGFILALGALILLVVWLSESARKAERTSRARQLRSEALVTIARRP